MHNLEWQMKCKIYNGIFFCWDISHTEKWSPTFKIAACSLFLPSRNGPTHLWIIVHGRKRPCNKSATLVSPSWLLGVLSPVCCNEYNRVQKEKGKFTQPLTIFSAVPAKARKEEKPPQWQSLMRYQACTISCNLHQASVRVTPSVVSDHKSQVRVYVHKYCLD